LISLDEYTVAPGTNTVLIMTSSVRNSSLLTEFLSSMDLDAPVGRQGRKMMERKLKSYLWWKSQLAQEKVKSKGGGGSSKVRGQKSGGGDRKEGSSGLSEALKKKDREREARQASRRRVRGGAPVNVIKREDGMNEAGGSEVRDINLRDELGVGSGEGQIVKEAEDIAEL
jgi:DNA excision repair protein ERCC-4